MSVSERADQFVAQLCSALVSQVDVAAPLSSASSMRAHLQGVFRGLPSDGAAGAMRTFLLRPEQIDASVARLANAIDKARRAKAVGGEDATTALFSDDAYVAALGQLDADLAADPQTDVTAAYKRLLTPFSAPTFVHRHMLRTLTLQSEQSKASSSPSASLAAALPLLSLPFSAATSFSAAPAALLEHLESAVLLARHFPVHASSLAPLSGLLDRAATRFALVTGGLPIPQLRQYQNLMSLLLLEEAKRRTRDQWTTEGVATFVARVRSVLRKTGSTGFSGTLNTQMAAAQASMQTACRRDPASCHPLTTTPCLFCPSSQAPSLVS